jgi:hypothetical protein
MDRNRAAAIDLVEAAYNLERPPADWLPNLLRAGEPLLDLGMGYYGVIAAGTSEQGVPIVTQVQGLPLPHGSGSRPLGSQHQHSYAGRDPLEPEAKVAMADARSARGLGAPLAARALRHRS